MLNLTFIIYEIIYIYTVKCMYFIYSVIFKMEPEIVVKTETLYYNLAEVFCYADKLKSLVENNWSTHIFWFPYNSLSVGDYNPKNDELWVRLTNKAPPSVDPEDWDFYTWRDTKDYISQSSLSAISPLMGELQSMVPYFNWVAFQSLKYVLYPSGEIHQEHAHSVHFRSVCTNRMYSMLLFFRFCTKSSVYYKVVLLNLF